jgi:hypothetical protein
MNAVLSTVSAKKNTYAAEDNKLYCNRYRANHKDKFNEYMREYKRSRALEPQLKFKQKMRWYKNNIEILEQMESLTKRQTGRLSKLKKLQNDLLDSQS